MGDCCCRNLCDDYDLDDVLAPNAGIVAIDIWSAASPFCRQAFETVARDFARRQDRSVRFARLQADTRPELVESLGVRSLPTVLICVDGRLEDAIVGRLSSRTLTRTLDHVLATQTAEVGFFSRLLGGLSG